ncbi:MAG: DUF4115 domain-containing protein [Geminicoccaceae bacterium]|nr:DUF4115 domain-containing protein [Geminicoccaceae bacterium]MCX7629674.1 DUF4115 domain-containing protein [Geminicoccaceae bacterium]MDW8123448.1 DUF4115 domain-containing protein [Geminicoccaceae bacterium]
MTSRAARETVDARDPRQEALRRVGAALRQAREARGEDLYAVAEILRIKPSYLFALEEGDLSMTPGRPYALGFLRSYADHLGFDGAEVVRIVKEQLDGAPPAPELAVPEPVRDERGPRGLVVAASILLAGLIYGSWHMGWREHPFFARVLALPGELGRTAGELLAGTAQPEPPRAPAALASARTDQTTVPAGAPANGIAASSARAVRPAPPEWLVASEPEETFETARMVPLARRDSTAALAAERPAPVAAQAPAPVTPGQLLAALDPARAAREGGGSEARVVLVAKDTAWVQIRSASRDYVRSRTLEPGERLALPDREDLALWTGNAGGIEVIVDGRSLGPLGEVGKVLREVPLAPAALKARLGGG